MHLALAAPTRRATGLGCARIRVGNETRRWRAGRVLFFDDSFEHEVFNDCGADSDADGDAGAERTVFQVVFEHPGLAAARRRLAQQSAPHAAQQRGGGEL